MRKIKTLEKYQRSANRGRKQHIKRIEVYQRFANRGLRLNHLSWNVWFYSTGTDIVKRYLSKLHFLTGAETAEILDTNI